MNFHNHELLYRAAKRIKDLRTKENCEESLLDFVEYGWPIIEPATPFQRGWVIEAIAEHLEAVTNGHIRRLLINVPPGFTKSLLTDVFWPAWEWGPRNMPHLRYVCFAYARHLTERDNMRCRNVVVNDRYQNNWGDRFQISNAQFTKVKFENTMTGWKLATSVGGIGTGERGDRLIIDDPNNVQEMESETIRESTKMWFTEVLPDRLNDQQKSAIVVIQQRINDEDVSGVALSRDMGYTHLCIPMEHDKHRHCVTVLGIDEAGEEIIWEDPRDEEYELAWPERFPQYTVDELKNDKGEYAWSSQYQQSPEPRGGAIIKRDFWQIWNDPKYPPFEFILASLDTAYTENTDNDPSAMTVWGLFKDPAPVITTRTGRTYQSEPIMMSPKLMLIYAWRGYKQFNELVETALQICQIPNDPKLITGPCFPVDLLLIENKAAGISVGQELTRLIGNQGKFGVQLVDPKVWGDKVARVHGVQHIFSSHMVYAPDKQFADMVINECAVFPHGTHDDLVDTTSMALRYFRDNGFVVKREEEELALNSFMSYKPKLKALYPV